jgi:hypothetical protein
MWYCPGIRLEKLSKTTKNLSPLAGLRAEIWIRHLPKSVLYISLFCSYCVPLEDGCLHGYYTTSCNSYLHTRRRENLKSQVVSLLFFRGVRMVSSCSCSTLQLQCLFSTNTSFVRKCLMDNFGVTEGNSWNYFNLFFWSNTNFLKMFSPRLCTYCTRMYLYWQCSNTGLSSESLFTTNISNLTLLFNNIL